jgi:hypothetical protein
MASALTAVLDTDDDDHPPRADRIARVAKLGANRGGFEGRAEFLANIDHMVIGRDMRLGQRVGRAWIVPALALAFELDDADRIVSDDDILVLRRDRATLLAYAIGSPWAHELASSLPDPDIERSRLGRITRGTMPATTSRTDDTPLGKLARAIRNTLPQPTPGMRVAIVERRGGALVIELGGKGLPDLHMRPATDDELAAAEPNRIAIEHAPADGTLSALHVCVGRLLERSDRAVRAGDPIKCASSEIARDE